MTNFENNGTTPYVAAEIEIVEVNSSDIICSSFGTNGNNDPWSEY